MSQPVYLDVDTGIDDALALLLAVHHPALDVRGITTVVGNVDLAQVTRNTLQVLELAGATDIPVAVGAERPLVAPARSAAVVHGSDGLGGANLPAPTMKPLEIDAVSFLIQELEAAEAPVTIIALAPLTNIALLLQRAPHLREKIERLAIMGGAYEIGNATPVAEFNIYHDPEAADIVFTSGVPILMYGLEVFRGVRFTEAEATDIFAPDGIGTPPRSSAELVAHLLRFSTSNFEQPDATIGDAGTVACVIDGSRLTTESYPVYVETGGNFARGQTIVDRRPLNFRERRSMRAKEFFAEVATDIDGDFYRDLFHEAITK